MALHPTLQPDASDRPDPDGVRIPADLNQEEREAGLFLAQIARTLASSSAEGQDATVVHTVLRHLVEQARLATLATGALLALAEGEELVCCAVSGAGIPEEGVRLNTSYGLSGACVQTRTPQRCDETAIDGRSDAVAFRELGIRSVLAIPLLYGNELLGILEIVSKRPSAFGDRDVRTLQALSPRMIEAVRSNSDENTADSAKSITHELSRGDQLGGHSEDAKVTSKEVRRRDYSNDALTFVVVALAIFVGWTLGRAGWSRATRPRGVQSATVGASAPAPPTATPGRSTPAVALKGVEPAAQRAREDQQGRADASPPLTNAKSIEPSAPPGGLIVSHHGKVIFRDNPPGQPVGDPRSASSLVELSPERAKARLVSSVAPEYPSSAKQQGLQGPVELRVEVREDGGVDRVRVLNGSPMLASAATKAVEQWRFRPYAPSGAPVGWQTRVTVNFVLPRH